MIFLRKDAHYLSLSLFLVFLVFFIVAAVSLSSADAARQRSKQKRGNSGGGVSGVGPYFRSVAREHQVEVHDRITFECDVGNLGTLMLLTEYQKYRL